MSADSRPQKVMGTPERNCLSLMEDVKDKNLVCSISFCPFRLFVRWIG